MTNALSVSIAGRIVDAMNGRYGQRLNTDSMAMWEGALMALQSAAHPEYSAVLADFREHVQQRGFRGTMVLADIAF